MPKLAREMTAIEVKRLAEPGLHSVGGVPGLCMQIAPSGSRSWTFRVMVGGKRRDMGMGGYPGVTLAMARDKARDARELIRKGIDPIEQQRAAQNALRVAVAAALTFDQCSERFIAAHEAGWSNAKHVQQWTNTLAHYASPVFGKLLIRDVDLTHILAVLEPIWRTKTETATRVRGRIESVLDWATTRGYREGPNPARWRGHLDKLMPAPSKVAKVEHHTALPVKDVGAFMARLRASAGMGALALEFAILTAARSGEVRGATPGEIDRKAKVWTIPGDRMKAGREHRVPLSDAAIKVLERVDATPRTLPSAFVFAAPRGGQLSDMTLTAVLRRLKVDAVPHGFRSTFRDWTAERTAYPNEVAEMALAHTVANAVEAAYRRGDLFEKRRHMMADWAEFVSKPEKAAEVVAIGSKRKRAPSVGAGQ
ncbi:MAG: integrase arm-type DNA-binding domain-containing protein [Burkholderiaceae bacterium]